MGSVHFKSVHFHCSLCQKRCTEAVRPGQCGNGNGNGNVGNVGKGDVGKGICCNGNGNVGKGNCGNGNRGNVGKGIYGEGEADNWWTRGAPGCDGRKINGYDATVDNAANRARPRTCEHYSLHD